jgi:hypothetical protein
MTDSVDNYQKMITGLPSMEGAGTQDYPEPSTEGTDWDVYRPACRKECRPTILKVYKPAWPMLKEDEHNN